MTRLLKHIEEMRVRLTEIANSEQALVKALGEALERVDEQLLADVRTVTAAHEHRRSEILYELHSLAARIGSFPTNNATGAVEAQHQHQHHAELPAYAPPSAPNVLGGGDWRQAANAIDDDLVEYTNGRRHSAH